jgi:PleD family two-component response regulator
VSIGVAFATTPTHFENLLAAADTAMFTEKRAKHAAQR